jgi:hypothetical protein
MLVSATLTIRMSRVMRKNPSDAIARTTRARGASGAGVGTSVSGRDCGTSVLDSSASRGTEGARLRQEPPCR